MVDINLHSSMQPLTTETFCDAVIAYSTFLRDIKSPIYLFIVIILSLLLHQFKSEGDHAVTFALINPYNM